MNKKINAKVEAVRRFFADSQASNHPIKEHPISKAEEYVRNLYFDMLCVVAQYECNDTENAFMLIKRIMSACENVQPLEEYIRRSMELTTEKTAEFIKQCKDNNLCEIFFVDSLLLSCSNGTPNAKQIAFLSQFGDMLGFDKANMTEIAKFAVAILEQDSEGYQEILNENNENIQTSLLCYAKEFVIGMIICTSKKRHYFAKNINEFTYQNKNDCEETGEDEEDVFCVASLEEVIFENLILSEYMVYESVKRIIIKNCQFKNESIFFSCCDEILIDNCIFMDIELKCNFRGAVSISNGRNFTISNSKFNNICNKEVHSNKFAGAIFVLGTRGGEINIINNCDFNKCRAYNYDSYYGYAKGSAVLGIDKSDMNIFVINCHFSNCEGDHLLEGAISDNNTFIGCCREW